MAIKAEPVLDFRADLGEGALWDAARKVLYWVDIDGKKAFEYNPSTKENRVCDTGQMVGTIVPRRSGGVAVALQDGIYSLNFDTRNVSRMVAVEENEPTRFNDGKCDPRGRFWAGTMGFRAKNAGTLYRIDPDLSVHPMVERVSISNGIIWTTDNTTMYYVDTPLLTVDAFDYDADRGTIANRRTVIRCEKEHGGPDGIWLDEQGNIWVAHYNGGCVRCWNPRTATIEETVEVPGAKMVTSCAFGGDDLDELYITTASRGLDDRGKRDQPNAGLLFKAHPGVRGIKAFAFDN